MAADPLDFQKRLEEAREEGRTEGKREGLIEAKLEQVIQGQRDTNSVLIDMRAILMNQTTTIARLETNYQQLQAEHLETKARIGRLENSSATKKEVDSVAADLKVVSATLNHFLLKLAIAGIGGGGAGAAALYGLLTAAGRVP